MFKKRNRQNTNRRGRNKEESSEEETISPIKVYEEKKDEIKGNNHEIPSSDNHAVKNVSTSSRLGHKSKIQSSLFSSNKPKFTKKVDLSKSYDDVPETDGIDTIASIELNINDIKKIQKQESHIEDSKNEASSEQTPIPNTQSLRSILRRRNQMSSSEEETQEGQDDMLLSESSSDEEARWERHLVERGVSGPAVRHSVIEAITHAGGDNSFSLVSQDHIMKRLSNALNELQVNYDENIRIISFAEKEIEEIEEEDQSEYSNKMKTEQRYDFYQKKTLYFRKLSGYLTDKRQELEEVFTYHCSKCKHYSEYLSCLKQYQWSNDYINQLYLMDDIEYLQQLECIQTIVSEMPSIVENTVIKEKAGHFFKGEIYYEKDFTQTRMADRTLYIENADCIKNSIQEYRVDDQVFNIITVPIDFYAENCIFYNYNDQSTEQFMSLSADIRNKILSTFDNRALQLMSIDQVLRHFKEWREEYPEDYENAFVSLSIDDFIPVILFPSLLQYDPLELQEENSFHSIHEMPWFAILKEFCETTTQQRDTLLLPRFIQKHVISYLNNIVLYEWNPLSIREGSLLKEALIEVAAYFNTVISELRTLYASVTQRIQYAIQSTVYFTPSLLSEKSNDIQTDAQEITEMYIMRGIRLLEVVNILAPFMTLGTAAPCIDNLVSMMCFYLKGMNQHLCLRNRCKDFATKVDALIPHEVQKAKQEIQSFI